MIARYSTSISDTQKAKLTNTLNGLVGKPFDGYEAEWTAFMQDTLHLNMSYLDGVRETVNAGRWRAKTDRIGFIRKIGQSVALKSFGLKDFEAELRNRMSLHVGKAIDPEQKRPLTPLLVKGMHSMDTSINETKQPFRMKL